MGLLRQPFPLHKRLRRLCVAALLPSPRLHPLPDDGPAADDGSEPHQPGCGNHISQRSDGLCHRGEIGEDADEPAEEAEPFCGAGPPEELWQQKVSQAVATDGDGGDGEPGCGLRSRSASRF